MVEEIEILLWRRLRFSSFRRVFAWLICRRRVICGWGWEVRGF